MTVLKSIFNDKLTKSDYNFLREIIYNHSGIFLADNKYVMVSARLVKRLKNLQIDTFKKYVELFRTKKGADQEIPYLINLITTNKTDFFRESTHIDLLCKFVKEIYKCQQIKIWSAACSTGEEPYSLSISLYEIGANYSILATDIDTNVLEIASKGIYDETKINNLSDDIKKKYFLKSKDSSSNLIKVAPFLNDKVIFKYHNLVCKLDTQYKFDIIFLRNALIYFDQESQNTVINNVLANLKKGGFIFLGHSESIAYRFPNLHFVANSVYQYL
ncbi:MAG: hypothetical protein JXA53_02880 [Bacteroidales bacterium]|nr:hypothetical protein [Bacteroidales bacterium]